ncbi:unnamed protein product [Parnassius apollo]|uniref:(apollo) hypothetical protein n=1 Tax=Parnassius apollo TaxID=110799 RepID=A0A8S3XIM8_PARAO|nr:unnamed protein product [Parnassius apollo]
MDAQSQHVARWLEETDEEEENDLEDLPSSEDEEDCCLEERHDSESEQESDVGEQIIPDTPSALQPLSESSSDEDVPLANLRIYKSKSGLEWQATPYRTSVRSQASNIRSRICGPKNDASACKTPISCFELYFNEETIDIITRCTNIYIDKIKTKYQRQRDAKNTDYTEIRAMIGMLLNGCRKKWSKNTERFLGQ